MVECKPSQSEYYRNVEVLIGVSSLYLFLFNINPLSVSAYYVAGCASIV